MCKAVKVLLTHFHSNIVPSTNYKLQIQSNLGESKKVKCLNYWSGVINWVWKPVSEYWGRIIAHSEWECRLLSWAEKIYSDEIQLVRGKLWQSEHRQIKIKTWLRNIKHTLINLVWVQIYNAMKDIPRIITIMDLTLLWSPFDEVCQTQVYIVSYMNIPIQSQ